MRSRARRIFERMAKLNVEVDVVAFAMGVEPHLDMSFFHVTDLVTGGRFERSVALAWPDGRVEVITSALEEASARKAPEAEVHVYASNDEKEKWLASRLANVRKVGVNAPEITLHDLRSLEKTLPKGAETVDVQRAVMEARLVKDARELARMQKAADVASRTADAIPGMLKDGLKEYELAAEIAYSMQKQGASGTSFPSIVSFGETSAEPHYSPADRALGKDQFVLCDFGAYVDLYASDITRTWVRGRATAELKGIYDTVLRAQVAALDAIRPGAKGADVHNAAKDVIDSSAWKGRFIHSIGHSLGLSVHDGAVLHPRQDITLEESMVVTVEPGIYVPGLGGVRIEDDVVVTKSGWRALTTAKKDFREV